MVEGWNTWFYENLKKMVRNDNHPSIYLALLKDNWVQYLHFTKQKEDCFPV